MLKAQVNIFEIDHVAQEVKPNKKIAEVNVKYEETSNKLLNDLVVKQKQNQRLEQKIKKMWKMFEQNKRRINSSKNSSLTTK